MIKGVIFDWAGTTIDFGCFAPLNVFIEIFNNKGIAITVQEAREPMGMLKKDHVRAILSMPRVSKLWAEKFNREFNENDVEELYSDFEPALMSILPDYTDIIDGVLPICAELRSKGIKIGSTTGYTRKMMEVVTVEAAKKGYTPDCIVTADDVGTGRPHPFMLYRNMQNLGLYPPKSVVKVGDTITDIQEGLNAGVWSVGIITGSSEMGLTESEYRALPETEKIELGKQVKKTFFDAGADYVINTINELPVLIDEINDSQNQYLLLTPGPLTTTKSVKNVMLKDWCTWDNDYNSIIQKLRCDLVKLATNKTSDYTAILMQGSGTFTVESVIGTTVEQNGTLLVITNGAYGDRIAEIAKVLKINTIVQDSGEVDPPDLVKLRENLQINPDITHVAIVHCETTTGMLNDIEAAGKIIKEYNKVFIVDAMSSFGGIPIDVSDLQIDFLVSSANKCIQGVPGFGFIVAKTTELKKCKDRSRSLSLNFYDQWQGMESGSGKWRYTSPTHVVRAFCQAVLELEQEGGITARYARYKNNQKTLVNGMKHLGFKPLLPESLHSPVITSFYYPENCNFSFIDFYNFLKGEGYVIYPGKISKAQTFRIGNIGDIHEKNIWGLLSAIEVYLIR
ncbi:MAG: 2-aminoethylphosphonate--pyruvate transaminase [Treponema sp.]|jgi:2-aminoethylphosphonate--pyruvate transaminase/phosphonoacetaldehyde hydrolase|nr:2-aminoethylphosphonate--pyruvate transaminase [Treponema sp.]